MGTGRVSFQPLAIKFLFFLPLGAKRGKPRQAWGFGSQIPEPASCGLLSPQSGEETLDPRAWTPFYNVCPFFPLLGRLWYFFSGTHLLLKPLLCRFLGRSTSGGDQKSPGGVERLEKLTFLGGGRGRCQSRFLLPFEWFIGSRTACRGVGKLQSHAFVEATGTSHHRGQ
jgi:hypothetical protein